jgi:chaperone required for assembly of F1-ATPase
VKRPNGERATNKPVDTGRALPRRFYQAATVAPVAPAAAAPSGAHDAASGTQRQGYRLLLDGKALRTPAKADFVVPTRELAEALAAEWQAQQDNIDPANMPLTRLVNSAIDGVAEKQAEVAAEIVNYGLSDLLCYRAADPGELVRRQADVWDPILAWCQQELGIPLTVTTGIVPVAQPEAAAAGLAAWLETLNAFELAAAHAMTTLMGSAVLAAALARGRLPSAAAWAAAHIDEDFQAEKWGVDTIAQARREQQWRQVEAASRLLRLGRPCVLGR